MFYKLFMKFEWPQKFYSGKEYEYDLVGRINTKAPKYFEELTRLQKEAQIRGYQLRQENSLPFKKSVEFVKKFQPEDPTNPKSDFARELRLAFAEKLNLEKEEEIECLNIYTCVDSPLDAHGIDFFISYQADHGREKEFIVTFDITKNPKKDVSENADLLIGDLPDPNDSDFNEEEYLHLIDGYAEKGTAVLKSKMQEKAA